MTKIKIERTVSLNGTIMPEMLAGTLYGGEKQAHEFTIHATFDGAPVTLEGTVTALLIRRADGGTVTMQGSIQDGAAVVTLAPSCYAQPGAVDLSIFAEQSGVSVCVYSAVANVKQTSTDTIIDPAHIVPDIQDVIAMMDDAEDAIDAANSAAAAANAAAQHSVRFDEAQALTDAQKAQARGNIGVRSASEEDLANAAAVISGIDAMAVRFDAAQSLTDAQKAQAKANIGAADAAAMTAALATKANVDGAYEGLTAGNAEQLIATVFEEDQVPYSFRTSGGSKDIGDREYDQIVGGTIAWNQLVQNGNFDGTTGWSIANDASTSISASGHVLTVTFGASASAATRLSQGGKDFRKDRIFLAMVDAKPSKALSVRFSYDSIADNVRTLTLTPDTWTRYACVIKMKANGTEISLYGNAGGSAAANDTIQFRNFVVFDLTQMFGVGIANYVYGLEQATAGAGAAWFAKLFPKAYYAYDAGTLMSVKVSSHDTVGFNAYDPAAGAAKLLGGNEYQITGAYTALSYTDINGNAEAISPDSDGLFTPVNDGTLTVTGGDSTTTCVHLTWSGYRNDEFEPYVKRSYALDSSLELRGVPNLDAGNRLYYSGDTYSSDGAVVRKYRVVNLRNLTWILNGAGSGQWTSSITDYRGTESSTKMRDSVCSRLFITNAATAYNRGGDQPAIAARGNNLWIYNPDWKNKTTSEILPLLEGIYYVYGLKTPNVEEAEPFQSPQVVDDFGTEEYVDAAVTASTPTRDVAILVGHVTQYPANLRDKLQHLPSPAAGNGRYVIVQAGGQMSLDEDTSPGRLTALEAKIPAPPTTNGTYWLGCQVTNDGVEYFWDIPAGT